MVVGETPQHLKTSEEIARECIRGLVRVLREEISPDLATNLA